ncbi:MAG: hypothetical protein E6J86_18030 [Deltaproteobacteria bacterium]|nr:MAG: hypothetical protein E6J86_18030 [Deltaproteobacteria bacterium]
MENSASDEAYSSGVSWAAVIAGAFVAAALSLILLALGAGFGLSAISPWSNIGASASTVGKAGIVWLIVTQIIASAMGGYLAGRLRTKWANVHTDEVYFRDTAHGFLVWAVGLVVTASFLASAALPMAGGAAHLGATMTTGASVQTDGIVANALTQEDVPAADRTYLAQLVASRTGLGQADAERRVVEVIGRAKSVADSARKTAAHLLLWIFLALLIGAFCASYAATIGGRQRDRVKRV